MISILVITIYKTTKASKPKGGKENYDDALEITSSHFSVVRRVSKIKFNNLKKKHDYFRK